MAPGLLTRRRFVFLTAAGLLGGGGYALTRAVQRVRDAARRTTDL
jgi:hypothetical protein